MFFLGRGLLGGGEREVALYSLNIRLAPSCELFKTDNTRATVKMDSVESAVHALVARTFLKAHPRASPFTQIISSQVHNGRSLRAGPGIPENVFVFFLDVNWRTIKGALLRWGMRTRLFEHAQLRWDLEASSLPFF